MSYSAWYGLTVGFFHCRKSFQVAKISCKISAHKISLYGMGCICHNFLMATLPRDLDHRPTFPFEKALAVAYSERSAQGA